MSYTIDQWIAIKCSDLDSDSDKQQWIDGAKLHINQDSYGSKYNICVALRACHDFTVKQQQQDRISSGAAGPITSKREGDLSINFANNSSKSDIEAYLGLTTYGLELLSIQKGTLSRFGVTGDDNDTIIPICCTGNN